MHVDVDVKEMKRVMCDILVLLLFCPQFVQILSKHDTFILKGSFLLLEEWYNWVEKNVVMPKKKERIIEILKCIWYLV